MTTVATQPSSSAWEEIRGEFFRTGDAETALARRTAVVDSIALAACAELLLPALPKGFTLLAVGGYGRRQLFPCSDVDLLLLFESERLAQNAKPAIGRFLQRLWDAGLRVSQSVRTPAECLERHDQNVELNISLLDRRYLAGDGDLFGQVAEGLPRFLRGQRDPLVRNLSRMARARHAKYHNTLHHLEPNIKETPGGLRDLQLIYWLDRLRSPGATNRFPNLEEPRRFLFRLRCCLHYLAGRDQNVLGFETQETIAAKQNGGDAAAWMREYYRNARAIHREALRQLEMSEPQASNLLGQFRDWRARLSNADFSVARERVYFRAPHRLEVEPEHALRAFEFVARHGVRLSLDAEQRLEAAELSALPAVWPALRSIFSLPHAGMAVRAMHETGVLEAIFPELRAMESLVIRDFYHRYTVDEHTVVAIQTLSELRSGPYAELLSEFDHPALLVFALLFHDVGKGIGPGHITHSLAAAGTAMERAGMPEPNREMVRFLIARHHDLSAAMQSRDPGDPATAQFVARQVETVERLKGLTLFTYADISAVNPQAMTAWRSEQLWRLYLAAYHHLTSALDAERIERPVATSAEAAEFLEGLPVRYSRTHSAAEIDGHVDLAIRSRERGVAVSVERLNGVYRATLVTRDRPNLFASVAGTLSSFGMNIVKAEAFANRRRLVVDTFVFADPARTLELNPSEVDRLQTTLERVVLGKADVRRLLQNRPAPGLPSRSASLPPRVSFHNDASPGATLIEIVAQDRPGLLYDLARAISAQGCNIEVVLVDTEAHKAIDVFYVTSEGKKLDGGKEASLKALLVEACRPPAVSS
jgi:[protein-PII] uridylyltransferase